MLDNIHMKFNLDMQKLVSTITDNGSNFVKAFQEYGIKIPIYPVSADNIDEESAIESEEDEVDEVEVDLFYHVPNNSNEVEFTLPKHLRCASHTLNLLATTDFHNAINTNASLKSRHERVVQKCNKLWKKASKPKSAEIIQEMLGHTLSYPCITRWNSFYNSMSQILKCKSQLKDLFDKLDLSKDCFRDTELQYLEEYCIILKPIAETLDFLQGENNTFYGYFMPSILSLKVKLTKLAKRFEKYFFRNHDSEGAIIAAATLPSIKLRWLTIFNESDSLNTDKKCIQELIINTALHILPHLDIDASLSPDNENKDTSFSDFFDFNEPEPTISTAPESTFPRVNLSAPAASSTVTASTWSEHNILESRTALKNKIELQLLVFW